GYLLGGLLVDGVMGRAATPTGKLGGPVNQPNGPQAGAGGGWAVIDEVPGGVVGQTTPDSCGPACGEMLTGTPQKQIIEKTGTPTHAQKLGEAIGGRGGYVGPEQLGKLLKQGPFAAVLYETGSPLHHFVVVDGLDDAGRILVRDPWNGGSTYKMQQSEFLRVWNGQAVFK